MVDEYGLDGLYGRPFGESAILVEFEIPVDLVGRDVVQPNAVRAHRLQHRVGADDVGVEKGLGVGERIVDVCLRGEVHDGVGLGDEFRHQFGVGDIALHQTNGVRYRRQRFAAAGVGERVEHRDLVLTHRAVHEVGADEARTPGNQQSHG